MEWVQQDGTCQNCRTILGNDIVVRMPEIPSTTNLNTFIILRYVPTSKIHKKSPPPSPLQEELLSPP